MTALVVDALGNAVSGLIFTAGCGGVMHAGGGIWRADGRTARKPPDTSNFWELPIAVHRDWVLAYCPQTDRCLFPPDRHPIPLPPLESETDLHVSPDARWIAITAAERVHLFERTGRTLQPLGQLDGQVVVARRDGITVRTPQDRLVHWGVDWTDLGALPAQTSQVTSDARGLLFALSPQGLFRRKDRDWRGIQHLPAP
jgi:hypothetical protein